MTEIVGVAYAHGVDLPDGVVERTVAFVETFPPDATTSMQRDLMAGLPSELEAQTGAVVRLGREAGAAVPLNATIYASLVLQEQRARAAAAPVNRDPEADAALRFRAHGRGVALPLYDGGGAR